MGELLGRTVLVTLALALCRAAVGAQEPEGKQAKTPPKAQAGAPREAQPAPEEGQVQGGAEKVAPPAAPSDLWVLNFEYQKVASIQPSEGVRRNELFWYLLYRIENKTGQDREAYISVAARSNKDKSYSNVYLPDVEAQIERKVGKPLWGKSDEVAELVKARSAQGENGAGKEQFNYVKFPAGEARDCVAIFNRLDPGANQVTITVQGLSNDLHLIEREGGVRQVESRVYTLELERPGDEYSMHLDRFRLVKKGWTKKLNALVVPKS